MGSQYFEDYQVGSTRQTQGRTMTETDIVLHAGQSGDFYPHHMDAEWCKVQEFRQRIAHGTLVFTMAVGLTAGEINPEAFTYGYDRLRFVKPVFHWRHPSRQGDPQGETRLAQAARLRHCGGESRSFQPAE